MVARSTFLLSFMQDCDGPASRVSSVPTLAGCGVDLRGSCSSDGVLMVKHCGRCSMDSAHEGQCTRAPSQWCVCVAIFKNRFWTARHGPFVNLIPPLERRRCFFFWQVPGFPLRPFGDSTVCFSLRNTLRADSCDLPA